METVVSIDPSFSRTGIYVREDQGFEYPEGLDYQKWGNHKFMSIDSEAGYPSFPYLYTQAADIALTIHQIVREVFPDMFIMEYPPPNSQWSAGLSLLDGLILDTVVGVEVPNCKIYLIPPQAVNSYMGARKVAKSLIVKRVKEDYEITGRLNHDKATAAMLYEVVKYRITDVKSKKPTIFELTKDTEIIRI